MGKRILYVMVIFIVTASQLVAQEKSQKVTLTGTVSTETGGPVRDSYLFIDGSKSNAKINRKGYYRINISNETNSIAVFSESYGFAEVSYTGQDTIDFVLTGSVNTPKSPEPNTTEIVNIGYGAVERDNITTSAGSVDNDRIQKHQFTNIYQMIQAQVPGVQVAGENITIRGVGTVNGSTQPIFVVDGIKVLSISNIDPILVESIDILKGPAASIYGVNGSNGVILINLK